MTDSVHPDQLEERPVLVVDYGAQYAQLIARRVREAGIYSEIVPHSMSTEKMLAKNPAAIVLSGWRAGLRYLLRFSGDGANLGRYRGADRFPRIRRNRRNFVCS